MRTAPTREERKARTRAELIAAADRLFTDNGFHATSLDAIADEAGYTKGAVYSNFAAKEDVFFAVYESRVERGIVEVERQIAAAEAAGGSGLEALALAAARRRGQNDGWLAVFFEFWAHVVRKPALRARFAEIHTRVQQPMVAGLESHARQHGYELPDDPQKLTVAMYAMNLGLALERLILPELVDERLGQRMGRLFLDDLARAGAQEGGTDDAHVSARAAG
jgi:AcrR family transcriptional regulator